MKHALGKLSRFGVRTVSFSLLLVCFAIPVYSQNTSWIKFPQGDTFNYCFDAVSSRNTTMYATGYYYHSMRSDLLSRGGKDVVVYTVNTTNGNEIVRSGGGTGDDEGLSLFVDPSNGSFYITGYFNGTAIFGNDTIVSQGMEDVFVAKYSSLAVLQWVESFGGPNSDRGTSVEVNGTSLVVCGSFTNYLVYDTATNSSIFSNGGKDGFFMKLNTANGVLQWINQFGGAAEDGASDLSVSGAGDIFVTGYFTDSAIFSATYIPGSGSADGFAAQYNSSGNLVWVTTFGGANADTAFSITIMPSNNNICVVGSFSGSAMFGTTLLSSLGNEDVFLAQINSAGGFVWAKSGGGPGYDNSVSVCADNSNIYIAGTTTDTLHLGAYILPPTGEFDGYYAKYDLAGNCSWGKRYTGARSNSLNNIFQNGSYCFVAGYATRLVTIPMFASHSANGKYGLFWRIAKSNGASDQVYYGLEAPDFYVTSLDSREPGCVYTSFQVSGVFQFDTLSLAMQKPLTSCIVKMDSLGNVMWRRNITPLSSTGSAGIQKILSLPSGGVIITGLYSGGSVSFDPSHTITYPSAAIYCARYDSNGNVLWAESVCSAASGIHDLKDMYVDRQQNILFAIDFTGSALWIYPSSSSITNSSSYYSGVFLKLSGGNGGFLGSNLYGSTGSTDVKLGAIATDSIGNIYITGRYQGPYGISNLNLPAANGASNAFIAKLNQNGLLIWRLFYPGYAYWAFDEYPDNFDVTHDGNIYFNIVFRDSFRVDATHNYITAPTRYDNLMIKYDSSGNVLWVDYFHTNIGNSYTGILKLTDLEELILCCNGPAPVDLNGVPLNLPSGNMITHVMKFNSSGTLRWDTLVSDSSTVGITGIGIQGANLYLGGIVNYPGADVMNVSIPATGGGRNGFITRFGNDQCPFPSAFFTWTNNSSGLFQFSADSLSATQWFWNFGDGYTDTIASPAHQFLNSGTYQVCLWTTNQCGTDSACQSVPFVITDQNVSLSSNNLRVLPNPANDQLNIESDLVGSIAIVDFNGRSVIRKVVNKNVSIDVSMLADGVYFVRFETSDLMQVSKLIIVH